MQNNIGSSSRALPQDTLPFFCKISVRPGQTPICGVSILAKTPSHANNPVLNDQGHLWAGGKARRSEC